MDALHTTLLLLILGSMLGCGGWALKKLWSLDVKLSGICRSVGWNTGEIQHLRNQVDALDRKVTNQIDRLEEKVEEHIECGHPGSGD